VELAYDIQQGELPEKGYPYPGLLHYHS